MKTLYALKAESRIQNSGVRMKGGEPLSETFFYSRFWILITEFCL
jgi:hypothetical protein